MKLWLFEDTDHYLGSYGCLEDTDHYLGSYGCLRIPTIICEVMVV